MTAWGVFGQTKIRSSDASTACVKLGWGGRIKNTIDPASIIRYDNPNTERKEIVIRIIKDHSLTKLGPISGVKPDMFI